MRYPASRDELDSTAPLSVCLFDGAERPDRAGDLGAGEAAVTSGVLGEILLVIGLGVVERRCVADLGRDRAVTGA